MLAWRGRFLVFKADTQIRSHRNESRRASGVLLLLAIAAAISACKTPPGPVAPELPFVIGPAGKWTGTCTLVSTPAGGNREVSGCIMEYMFVPGSVVVTVGTAGMGALDSLNVLACQTTTACPAVETVRPSQGTGPNYSVFVPLPSPAGISRICATIEYFDPTAAPPGGPPTRPNKSLPLGCVPVAPTLTAAVGAFKITPTINGLIHEGWFIDPTIDSPAQIVIGRGLNPIVTATAVAGGVDARSRETWPTFTDQHGFTTTLPFAGSPAMSQMCVWKSAAQGNPLACFGYQEQTAAYADASVTRGNPLRMSVRNVPANAAVSVNLRAAGGHFWLPWTHPAIWKATADASGAVNIDVPTDLLPPGQYLVAYHCAPECPGGNLDAAQLIGGESWTGRITWGPSVSINSNVTRGLTVTQPMTDKVRVAGTGFRAGETVGVFVVPPLENFDGFPYEVTPVAYTEADAQGAFTVDVDVKRLPIAGPNNQVIVMDSTNRPVAATMFASP
jgi:hypothetical protein